MAKRRILQRFTVFTMIAWLAALAYSSVSAREDVPEDTKAMKNPVTLEEDEIRYYQRQFKGKCARCHGIDGTGSGVDADASEGLVRPANFTDAEYMASRTDGELFYQIEMGGGERCAMPAFGPESDHGWNEDRIWHMVAFIRRFSDPGNR